MRRTLFRAAAVTFAGLFLASFALAAEKPKDAKPPTLSESFEGLQFRCIGPYRGGRAVAVTGVRQDNLTYYFGGTGGGVWKTSDAGANWEPVSDKDFKTGSVGAIEVSESDPNVIYVGMGESPIRGNLSHGDGVWKSTDGGQSWKNIGLRRRGRSRACAFIRPTRTSSTSPRSGTPGGRTRSAASTAPRTAARPGRRCSSSTRRREPRISRWIP